MIFDKPPTILYPIILLAGFVLCWTFPASGWVGIALPIIGLLLAGFSVVTWTDWIIYRNLYYQTMKKDQEVSPELELARLIRSMDDARFKMYALALIKEYGDNEETGEILDQYMDIRTSPTDHEERQYRQEVLNYIKHHNGELPAIRETSEGSARRRILIALTAQLVKENAAVPAVGNRNAKITDYNRAVNLIGGK